MKKQKVWTNKKNRQKEETTPTAFHFLAAEVTVSINEPLHLPELIL